GAGASFVFDHNLMTPDFRELVGEDAGDGVRRSSRGHRHDDAHHSIRPIQRFLGPRRSTGKMGRKQQPGGSYEQAAARGHGRLTCIYSTLSGNSCAARMARGSAVAIKMAPLAVGNRTLPLLASWAHPKDRDDGCSTEKPQAAMRCDLGSRDLRMNRKQRRAMRTQGRDIGVESSQASPKAAAGRLFGQAVWHQHHGKPNEAVKLYKQVLELQPDHAEASNNLGCVLLAQGKREAASGCFERALMLVPQLFDDFDSVTAMLAAVNPALAEGMKRAASAWPQRVPLADL